MVISDLVINKHWGTPYPKKEKKERKRHWGTSVREIR